MYFNIINGSHVDLCLLEFPEMISKPTQSHVENSVAQGWRTLISTITVVMSNLSVFPAFVSRH